MHIFAKLVRSILGATAISDRKLAAGNPLTVLGIECFLDQEGAAFRPDKEKIVKWSAKIRNILDAGLLHSGEASKLSGALQWAGQHSFKKLGRAMLRPIFRQGLYLIHIVSRLTLPLISGKRQGTVAS